MCFSASASFTAAAVLVPLGVVCLKKTASLSRPYWVFALLPLVFGLQQVFEGVLWLALQDSDPANGRYAALGFMFFSHLFWLVWIPLGCYLIETRQYRARLFMLIAILGALHGLMMYLPLYSHANWLQIEIVRHSIVYEATLFYDDYVPRIAVRGLYAVLVLVPLLMCSDRYVRMFGIIIAISVVIATVFFAYAFISVWCYFAAVLSLYMWYMVQRLAKQDAQAVQY